MSSVAEQELEQLIQFLYIAPVGLLEFDLKGQIIMANPTITQIFNPFCTNGLIANIFDIFNPQLPDLVDRVVKFDAPSGNILNNERHILMAPTSIDGQTPPEELYLDITINKQRPGVFFASLNNVTDQVKVQRESFINSQHLKAILARVQGYAILTLDNKGTITDCSNSGTDLVDGQLLGKMWCDVMELTAERAQSLMQVCQQRGWLGFHLPKPVLVADHLWGDIMLTVVNDAEGNLAGYSLIVRDSEN